jgi:hypothetical protein
VPDDVRDGVTDGRAIRLIEAGTRGGLWLVLPLVLAAVAASTGLVAYAAFAHDLATGLFAVVFASLSGRASISWCESRQAIEEPRKAPAPQSR